MKKSAVLNFDYKEIQYDYSFFRERIIFAGEKLSDKYSIIGVKHRFILHGDEFLIHSKYNFLDKSFLHLEVFKNERFIKIEILKLSFVERLPWIIFGIFMGIVCYQLLVLLF